MSTQVPTFRQPYANRKPTFSQPFKAPLKGLQYFPRGPILSQHPSTKALPSEHGTHVPRAERGTPSLRLGCY